MEVAPRWEADGDEGDEGDEGNEGGLEQWVAGMPIYISSYG